MVQALDDPAHALQERHPRRGCGRHPAVPRREQRVLVRQGADGADGHLVPAVRHRGQPHRRPRRRRRARRTRRRSPSCPIPFPDVAGKGNPSTMFADPDAGHAVNAKSKNRNAAITFALWMGGTKEGQQIVVNNMDSFATLNGVTPQFDKIKLVNPKVQQPELEEGHRSARRGQGLPKLRHLRPAEPGDHRRQPGDGEQRQAPAEAAQPTSRPWPTPTMTAPPHHQ